MTRADLDKKPAEVAAMFDALAGRYDLMNDILSMGQVRLWRQRVRRILQAGPGDRVLVPSISACGTCRFCRDGRYGQCGEGRGWALGNLGSLPHISVAGAPFVPASTVGKKSIELPDQRLNRRSAN